MCLPEIDNGIISDIFAKNINELEKHILKDENEGDKKFLALYYMEARLTAFNFFQCLCSVALDLDTLGVTRSKGGWITSNIVLVTDILKKLFRRFWLRSQHF